MRPIKLETFLPDLIERVASDVGRSLSAVYRDTFGLSLPEWRTLATVGELETCTATQISAHCRLHKTEISRALANLRQRRLLSKRVNKEDRREDLIRLTATGRRTYERMAREMRAVEQTLRSMLGPAGARSLTTALAALEAQLNEE